MRYDEEQNRIFIGVSELVCASRRVLSLTPPKDEAEPTAEENRIHGKKIEYSFCQGGYDFTLTGMARISENTLTNDIRISRKKPTAEEKKQARGEAYLLGKMLFESDWEGDGIPCIINYVSEDGTICESEVLERKKCADFTEKCIKTLPSYARAEIERVTKRLPSMKNLKFPYKSIREGQEQFIKAAYRTLARGGELYAAAPTGTGKTVSAIFPAVRALGSEKITKVFYLTPKTTTANAARDCIELLCANGAMIRGIILIAKERLCEFGQVCKEFRGACQADRTNRLYEAVFALFDKALPVVTPADVKRTAADFSVCPYELSLSYAELCDVIVGDFNYLFHPTSYIKRFFSFHSPFAFLIDEAHNLPDRAREMYSAEIELRDFELITESAILGEASQLKTVICQLKLAFKSLLYPLVKDELRESSDGILNGAYHTKELPGELLRIFSTLTAAVYTELYTSLKDKGAEAGKKVKLLRDFLYKTEHFLNIAERFDDCYELFVFASGEELRAKLFCIDTKNVIRERLALGEGAVFFSATLAPLYYYRAVLGGDNSSASLTVDSPFTREQVSVSVMDKISTRFSEREDTLSAVCRVIAATLSAKRGSYMIFSPSYAYSKALYDAFRMKYPKIKSILQTQGMSNSERQSFLDEFSKTNGNYLAAFCVLGGIYSEGIDLAGDSLIGAVIVGIGMPAPSYEREAIAAYYDEKYEEGKQFAYLYPGMNRVMQAAGRVIRTEDDVGVIVLIDDRFDDPIYRKTAPSLWRGMKFLSDAKDLKSELDEFWKSQGQV